MASARAFGRAADGFGDAASAKIAKEASPDEVERLLGEAIASQGLETRNREVDGSQLPTSDAVESTKRTDGQRTRRFVLALEFLAELDPNVLDNGLPAKAKDVLERADLAMKHLARVKRLWIDDGNG